MQQRTREQIKKTMQAVKSKGSKIERRLATALWKKGYRYRKNDKTVFGKPDLTFKQIKVAIFVDSEFWHGKDWLERKHDHKSNQKYWYQKIEGNIKRDEIVTKQLVDEGWKVLRFWGSDIEKELESCINEIEETINDAKKI